MIQAMPFLILGAIVVGVALSIARFGLRRATVRNTTQAP